MRRGIMIFLLLAGVCGCSSDNSTGGLNNPPLQGTTLPVDDLTVVGGTQGTVALQWTSPQLVTKAAGEINYDLRYTLFSLSDSPADTWAISSPPASDSQSGIIHQHTVSGLSAGQVYVFSLRSSIDQITWCDFSEMVVATAAEQYDTTPPGAITALRFWSSTATNITIRWPAAGDDGDLGQAVGYEVRYATSSFSQTEWDQATMATGEITQDPQTGILETTITGLAEGQDYYLAVRARDDLGNQSDLSNLLQVTAGQSRTWYITVDGLGDLPTIEAAIDVAGPGDEILVGPGRYTWTNQGTGDFYGLILIARERTGFTLISEAGPEATILDAEGIGGVIHIQGYNDVVIDGFTITRGNIDGDPEAGDPYAGGGIASHLANPLIRNCIITNNYATEGGGVWLGSTGQPRMENCIIENNSALQGGGIALINDSLHISISNCIIRDNYANLLGGGVLAYNTFWTLENCQITGNTSGDRAGGLAGWSLHDGCLVTGSTLADNSAPTGSAIRVYGNFSLEVQSSIVAFNTGGPAFSAELGAGLIMGCSDVFGHPGGQAFPTNFTDLGGNFLANPLFCPGGSYSLQEGSPCAPGNHPDGADCGQVGAGSVTCPPVNR